MFTIKRAQTLFTAASLVFGTVNLAHAEGKIERPPQFVMLAFDGSFNIEFWKESRGFAKQMKDENKSVAWTYFISGVYYLNEKNYALYMPPHQEAKFPNQIDRQAEVQRRLQEANSKTVAGSIRNRSRAAYSQIGFGNAAADVAERIAQTNMAFEEGHEIASHANGHYSGGSSTGDSKRWSTAQWNSEFRQFNELIFNAYENNNIPNTSQYSSGYAFGPEEVVGFRAPMLDANDGMFKTLADYKYKYDTSGTNSSAERATKWPSKNDYGTWVLPLGEINLFGTGKSTASMDYNFFMVQSHGVEDAVNKDKYSEQMYQSYMKYFNDNYYGNRAPVHIGHHFSKWNGGAYWNAMKRFASQVCGQKEVRCGTYTEYVKWLDEQSAAQIKSYNAAAFQKVTRPASLKSLEVIGSAKPFLQLKEDVLTASAVMDRRSKLLGYKLALKVNNVIEAKNEVTLKELRARPELAARTVVSAVVLNRAGDEIQSYTLKVNNLGQVSEHVEKSPLEERANLGDLPEAHDHEGSNDQ